MVTRNYFNKNFNKVNESNFGTNFKIINVYLIHKIKTTNINH